MIEEENFVGKLYNKQKAIGFILLLPSYLYYVPVFINFLIKLYIDNATGEVNTVYLGVILNFAVGLICTTMTAFVLKDFIIESFLSFKENLFDNVIWSCSVGIGIVYGLSIIANLIVMFLLGNQNQGSANQQLFETYLSSQPILMFVQAVIFAPILEELLFRGIIFRTLREKGKILAHVVAAGLFGFLHVYSGLFAGDMTQLIHMLPYVLMGFAFGYAYEKKGTIFVPIVVHALNNFIAILLSLLLANL